jgi:hypothetical protein
VRSRHAERHLRPRGSWARVSPDPARDRPSVGVTMLGPYPARGISVRDRDTITVYLGPRSAHAEVASTSATC